MDQQLMNCPHCGVSLDSYSRYCKNCGFDVTIMPASTAPTQAVVPDDDPGSPRPIGAPEPGSTFPEPGLSTGAPYGPPPTPRSRRGCWIAGGIIVLAILCLAVTISVGLFALRTGFLDAWMVRTPTPQTMIEDPTPFPTPTDPVPPLVDPLQTPPTGRITPGEETFPGFPPVDPNFEDDFSTNFFNWEDGSDDEAAWGYENGSYYIQIFPPNFIAWVHPPTQFTPVRLEFEARLLDEFVSENAGTFGAICYYQDPANFVMIEIDLVHEAYLIGRFDNDVYIQLTEPDWIETGAFQAAPAGPVSIRVGCDEDTITLSIDGQQVEPLILDPPPASGRAALFVATPSEPLPQGFKVLFDRFAAWGPVP